MEQYNNLHEIDMTDGVLLKYIKNIHVPVQLKYPNLIPEHSNNSTIEDKYITKINRGSIFLEGVDGIDDILSAQINIPIAKINNNKSDTYTLSMFNGDYAIFKDMKLKNLPKHIPSEIINNIGQYAGNGTKIHKSVSSRRYRSTKQKKQKKQKNKHTKKHLSVKKVSKRVKSQTRNRGI